MGWEKWAVKAVGMTYVGHSQKQMLESDLMGEEQLSHLSANLRVGSYSVSMVWDFSHGALSLHCLLCPCLH